MATNLTDVLDAHEAYRRALKKHRNLRKDVARHLAAAIPKGLALEWSQGTSMLEFTVSSIVVFEASNEDPIENGYFLDDDVAELTVPGLTRDALRKLTKTWKSVPFDLLQLAYGDSTVRVLSTGKFEVTEE